MQRMPAEDGPRGLTRAPQAKPCKRAAREARRPLGDPCFLLRRAGQSSGLVRGRHPLYPLHPMDYPICSSPLKFSRGDRETKGGNARAHGPTGNGKTVRLGRAVRRAKRAAARVPA